MMVKFIYEKQKNISLSALREIFMAIDSMAASHLDERKILNRILQRISGYELRFLRWLVRHTLHPETDDDIMPDEIVKCDEHVNAEGSTVLKIGFARIPPTVELYSLIQYRHTFWQISSFNQAEKTATLKLLSDF